MRKLGRGLGAILEDVEEGYLKSISNKIVREIEISKIVTNPFQPRRVFNQQSINELAKSIEKYGLMQPIIVIKEKEKYILVAGERRVRAFKSLGRNRIKAIISDISLSELREYALIENIQREDLNAIDIAISLKALIDEYGFTHEELAKNIGKSRAYISNMLRLLNLPDMVKNKIIQNQITYGHAKVLIGLSEDEVKKSIEKIEKDNLSVRETEKFVRALKKGNKKSLNKDINSIALKFRKLGFDIDAKEDFIKIKLKNETDLEKLEKLIDKII